ncbi:MAG: thiamine phosphate synthase [Victivallales bacterium]|jgi:thiamine-phosphate pyrophosphorylase|nr:thiamine phosphate synthase [Victivallales bacterium]
MIKSCFETRSEKRTAFESSDIYPVISSEFCLGRSVVEVFRAVAEGGAKVVQLREKHQGKKALYELALECRSIANQYGVLLIINDHVDVALSAGADGVHLGQDDLSVEAARSLSETLWIGNSTHNLAEAIQAQEAGADCINIGPIYPTQTKEVGYDALGVEQLKLIAPHVHIPFSVMGGIKACHIPELVSAGAMHIAMVTEITQADDVAKKVRTLRELF